MPGFGSIGIGPIGFVGTPQELAPPPVGLVLTPVAPALHGIAGPAAVGLSLSPCRPGLFAFVDCWTMYYDYSARIWILEGGNGMVRYTMSQPFRPGAANVFDVILFDLTAGKAPASVTVWPLSDGPVSP